MKFLVALAAMLLAAAGPASALTFEAESTHEGPVVVVSGEFLSSDDFGGFERLVRDSGARTVTFDSAGGQIYPAMELGRLIRRLGLETVALRSLECSSACAFAFLGGVSRYAEPGAIGMHRSWLAPDPALTVEQAVEAVQQVTSDSMSYIGEMGADPNLMQLALRYDSNDMRYLSLSEMERFRVITIAAAEQPGAGGDVSSDEPASLPHDRSAMTVGAQEAIPELADTYQPVNPPTQGASLYEYGPDGRIARIVTGEVAWSEFDLWRASKAAYEPAIRAEVRVADRFALRVAITHNADPAFWAASVATLTLELSPGIRIASVAGLSRERPGAATRQMLTVHHAAAKPERGWFRLALQPAATSLDLLGGGDLLCFDFVYESSQDASLCLAKGARGKAVFARTVSEWRKKASDGAASDASTSEQPASPASLEPDQASLPAPRSREALMQPPIADWSVPAARSGRVRHPKGHAPLMPLPGVEWPALANFDNGAALEILRTEERWYQVQIGMAVGYMHSSWVYVDQYDAGGFEQALHIQIRSFDNFPEAESFAKSSPIPVTAYLVNNGWYAVVLRDRLEKDRARTLADHLKKLGKIPADSFMTYGNIYVRKVCCG
jgi:hypothetical protein